MNPVPEAVLCRLQTTPEARGSGTCLCPRARWSCSKAHSGPVRTYPRGLWRVIPEAVCPVSSQPIQLSSNRCLGPTPEGVSEGMKWRELGAPGLLSGRSCGQGTWGRQTPATWVAAFFASGWSGGENDLTCLKEPWVVAGIWGRRGVPRARQRGAWGLRTPPPPSLAAAQPGCLWSGPGAGDRPPPWLAPAQQPLPSHGGESERG